MPQRFKYWIRRTRGYRLDKIILAILFFVWYLSGFVGYVVTYTPTATPTLPGHGSALERSRVYAVRVDDGCLTLITEAAHSSMVIEGWQFYTNTTAGFDFLPRWKEEGTHWSDWTFIALPLWLLPLAWAIFWITRMVRAERRELKKWSGSLQEP